MSKPQDHPRHPGTDSASHDDKAGHDDKATTAKNLLADTQGRWLDKSKPDAVAKLVADGVLPEGSQVIDFGKVSAHLDDDKKALTELDKTPVPLLSTFVAALDADKTKIASAQTDLDSAQAGVDAIQKRIDDRTKQSEQVQKDFDTISKDTKDTYFYASNLKSLSEDSSKSPEVRDAAKRLLDTFKSDDGKTPNSEYASTGWRSPYIDQDSIKNKTDKDAALNKDDTQKLGTATTARDQAKGGVDALKSDMDRIKNDMDKAADTQNSKTAIEERIKREEDALKPSSDIARQAKVARGEGYYQVAERLLGLHGKGHTFKQEAEVKMLTRLLQEEERSLNKGRLPKALKQNDELLNPERLAEVFEKMHQLSSQA
jgi:hypothetical protein